MLKKLGFIFLMPAIVMAEELPDAQHFNFSVGVQGQQQEDLQSNILSAEMNIPLFYNFSIGFSGSRTKNIDSKNPDVENTERAFGSSLFWRDSQKGRVGFAYTAREWEYDSPVVIDDWGWTLSESEHTKEKYASTEFFADSYLDYVTLGYKHLSVHNFFDNSWERDIVSISGYIMENIRLQYMHSADDFPFGNYETDALSFAMQITAPIEVTATLYEVDDEEIYQLGVQYHFQNSGTLKKRDRQYR